MSLQPPPRLVETLERLGLAGRGDFIAQVGRVKRLGRGLPQFESVWIDALAQGRVLTPFQAGEINAGRGAGLRVGPYVVQRPLGWPYYAAGFLARHAESGQSAAVGVVELRPGEAEIIDRVRSLAAAGSRVESSGVAAIVDAGADGPRRYVAAPWPGGRSVAELLIHRGRIPAEIVLHLARQMAAALAALQQAGVCHADIAAEATMLTDDGRAVLLFPGLRALLRPQEGYCSADLPAAAFDGLAPERIAAGAPPTVASDQFACGALWWRMLVGRPALPGGTAAAKMQSAHACRIEDIRRLVPYAPGPLVDAIGRCLAARAEDRPGTMTALAELLGPPTEMGSAEAASWVTGVPRPAVLAARTARAAASPPRLVVAATLLAAVVLGVASIGWRPSAEPTAATPRLEMARPPEAPTDAKPLVPAPARPLPAIAEANAIVAAGHVVATPPAVEWASLTSGQQVKPRDSQRLRVVVPPQGVWLGADGLLLENLDFVAEAPTSGVLVLQPACRTLRLVNCSFSGPGAAIVIGRDKPGPMVEVRAERCLFQSLSAVVDSDGQAALAVELAGSLATRCGPVVRLRRPPGLETPAGLALVRSTLRDCGPLVECLGGSEEHALGALAVRSTDSVLWLHGGSPLLLFHGPAAPDRLLERIEWAGQGSVARLATPVAVWQPPRGGPQPLPDTAVAISGVVRGELTFAGDAIPGGAAVVEWQAPLRSSGPPGADAAAICR